MSRDATLNEGAIRAQFQELADLLDEAVDVYLIGGGALTLQELKNATKDIDLIVETAAELERLRESLVAADYSFPEDIREEYEDLEAAFILEKGARRFDVFHRQVAGELMLTDTMKERSQHLLDAGPLTVRMVSLNDIFLFKSVANRADDVDDMVTLAQAGIDETVIMAEAKRQIGDIAQDAFVRSMKQKLDRLADAGYAFDIHDEVDALYAKLEAAERVEQRLWSLYDTEYRDDLYAGVPRDRLEQELAAELDVAAALEWLQRVERVEVADDESLVPIGREA
jgi:hypothetical protein